MTAPDLESIERAAILELHREAPAEVCRTLGLACEELGGALLSIGEAIPASGIVVNRVLGLGEGRPARREDAAAIVERYRRGGVARYFVHVHPDARPPELRRWLQDLGLQRARSWVKFIRGPEPPPEVATDLEVRALQRDDRAAFGRIQAAAFDLGEAAAPWMACLDDAPHWHAYVSVDHHGQVAGAAALFVRDGIGWLDWGATDPAFRQRGSQAALLRHRIRQAVDMGCRTLVTATGEEVPGDPQHSYRNIVRMGFRESYARENYALPWRG